jgi:hypothetical protein
MRIPTLVLCFLLLAGVSAASAQGLSFGAKGGVNFANIAISPEVDDDVNFNYILGLAAGAFVVWPVTERLDVQPEVLYSRKGVEIGQPPAKVKAELDYLEIPVIARYRLRSVGGAPLRVFGGPSFGFRLRAREKARFGGETMERDISEEIERFDLGLVGGAGVEIGRIVIDGRYTWGVADIDSEKEDDVKVRNRVISVMGGFRF